MSHRDSVVAASRQAPESSPARPRRRSRPSRTSDRGLYGVQFHPEVVHTAHGMEMLKNFLYDVADAPPLWTPASVIEDRGRPHSRAGRVGSGSSARSRAASTRRSPRCSSTRPSATSSPASSSITAFCARTRPSRWSRPFATPLPRTARPRRRGGALPRAPGRGRPTPRRSGGASARSSSASSRTRRGSSAACRSSCRARSTRT